MQSLSSSNFFCVTLWGSRRTLRTSWNLIVSIITAFLQKKKIATCNIYESFVQCNEYYFTALNIRKYTMLFQYYLLHECTAESTLSFVTTSATELKTTFLLCVLLYILSCIIILDYNIIRYKPVCCFLLNNEMLKQSILVVCVMHFKMSSILSWFA